ATGRPGDADFGEVSVVEVPYPAVQSLFADETDAPGLATAARAVRGLDLAEAWDHPAVNALLENSDLLWHGPGEWSSLVAG
ncbi:MAG: hypothetical protein WAL91_00970, partial [Propionicimonas sp.]